MPIPIVTVAEMREWERATWATGQTEAAVIERVGESIAQRLMELTKAGDKILIVAGKGHNGDDARAAIPHLSSRGVTLLDVVDPAHALGELSALPLHNYTFLVDGLFGIGLNRPLNEDWKRLIDAINRTGIPIVAIDVPSGLNADTGRGEGACVEAAITLTIEAPKCGLLCQQAIPFVGRLETLADIGLVPGEANSELNWVLCSDFKNFPGPRSVVAHKGSFGHVAIIAGSLGYHGAGVLAARGAARAQPGLVTLYTQSDVYLPVASQTQAVMVHPWRREEPLPEKCTAVLFGPGLAAKNLSDEFKNALCDLWRECPLPVVVDATALDWLPSGNVSSKASRIITPHPGEAARLLRRSTDSVQQNRVAALRDLSNRFSNCWVVLKGHQTLIGQWEGVISVNSSGNPHLAQGGSGDVLAGFLAGLIAQPALAGDVHKTLAYGVWRHGDAADRLARLDRHWTIEDLAAHL